jgi:SAM-dependent methyltransferase
MSLPLAQMGYVVTASDVNPNMLRRARQNFAAQEMMATFVRSDILDLEAKVRGPFDAVLATGNSLGHVPGDRLEDALHQMDAVLRPGGLLYFDTLNWDLVQERQQRFYLFNPLIRDKGRVNYLQVWDYNPRRLHDVQFSHLRGNREQDCEQAAVLRPLLPLCAGDGHRHPGRHGLREYSPVQTGRARPDRPDGRQLVCPHRREARAGERGAEKGRKVVETYAEIDR